MQRNRDGQLAFTRPDGKVLEHAPQSRRATQWVEDFNSNNGIGIDHGTVYRQRDRSIDYGMAVDVLVQCQELAVTAEMT